MKPRPETTAGYRGSPMVAGGAQRTARPIHFLGNPIATLLRLVSLALALFLGCLPGIAAADPPPALNLWPGRPPGETAELGPEGDTTKPTDNLIAGQPLIRLGNVSNPTLQVFRPPPGKATGAAVLVCPGGGYHILALDLEGTEVCEWLNSIGVTGILLKYRVPRRPGLAPHAAPLQDAQRAMSLLRQSAPQYGIDPHRIGALGFSAGGHLAAALSTATDRTYPKIDSADDLPFRPDFAFLIYPGYLALKDEDNRLPPELKVGPDTPPTFLVMAQDDPVRVENVLYYALALQQAKAPFELHVYPKGGHGYGLRRTELPVTAWPDRAADWMRAQGWLAPR